MIYGATRSLIEHGFRSETTPCTCSSIVRLCCTALVATLCEGRSFCITYNHLLCIARVRGGEIIHYEQYDDAYQNYRYRNGVNYLS
jgi:hypothetical protein